MIPLCACPRCRYSVTHTIVICVITNVAIILSMNYLASKKLTLGISGSESWGPQAAAAYSHTVTSTGPKVNSFYFLCYQLHPLRHETFC